MVESRRKHGSFDHRYPPLSAPETPTWVQEIEGGLDWTAFLARFFPGSHRHDIDALAAYGAYRSGESRPPGESRAARESRAAANERPVPVAATA